MTGRWRCTWREISVPSELFCTDKDTLYTVVDGKVHMRDLSSLVSAKLACEDMGSKCEGILEVSVYDYTQYEVVKSGSGTQCPSGNSMRVWEKQCQSNDAKHIENMERRNGAHSGSRTKRRIRIACEDRIETNIYHYVEQIPLINMLWSAMSSVVYELGGCYQQANRRILKADQQVGGTVAAFIGLLGLAAVG